MCTINHSRWCGAKRCDKALRIYEVLRNKGLTGTEFAKSIGISKQSVSQTISGRSHSERVLNGLRELGVPEKYLFDPRNVKFDSDKIERVA